MVTVEGLDDALRLVGSFPGDTRRAQVGLVLQAARGLRRKIRKDVRKAAPKRSGQLQRSIAVRVDKQRPAIVIGGSRALVPSNAESGWLTRATAKLQEDMNKEVVDVIIQRIQKLQRG